METTRDNGRPSAVVHLDADGASAIFAAHGWRYLVAADPLFQSGLLNFLDWFDQLGIRATVFVIAQDLDDPSKRELLEEVVRRGHQIGSHSLTHRKLTALAREEKRREIYESRERLAAHLGVDVHGFRAPGFAMDRETLELIDAAGYRYDSSVFPTRKFARRLKLTQLEKWPHLPLEDCGLVELPLPSHQPLPVPFHPSYSLVLGLWYFRVGLASFQQSRAPLVLLFHLTDLADPLPKHQLPVWKAKLYTLSHLNVETKRRRCEEMLALVRQKYDVLDTMQLLATNTRAATENTSGVTNQ